jgi:putative oxygen-independent coproporphyrinogen III oxidase
MTQGQYYPRLPRAWRIIPENYGIQLAQNGILPGMKPTSIYLHIPFCQHRCAYCDFNTYAGKESLIPEYVEALCLEIQTLAELTTDPIVVHTIFFGGGTPSLLPSESISKILGTLRACFQVIPNVEITLEANPGTVSARYLNELLQIGINRISLGMQSSHLEELHLLERQHDFFDVLQAMKWANKAGLKNVNLDLMFGLPGQSIERWQTSLETALSLSPTHLSLYALTLEHKTPMYKWVQRGIMSQPDPDAAADMYERAEEFLEGQGFYQYEISNWARLNEDNILMACQHNLQYWHLEPYLGLGAGAHGFIHRVHTRNVLSPALYIQRLNAAKSAIYMPPFPHTPATASLEAIQVEEEMKEVMMMGLRLTEEGVSNSRFESRFGISLHDTYGTIIDRLVHLELLEWIDTGTRKLRLTPKGRLLGNLVFMEFV